MKKFFAILLAAIMMLSMTAMAATITINEPATGVTNNDQNNTPETYKAYKILNADSTGTVYSIPANDTAWLPVLQDTDQTWLTLTPSADASVYVVTWKEGVDNANDGAAVKALATYLNENIPTGVTGQDIVNGSTIEDGYFLITSSLGTALVLDTAGESGVTINEKNSYPSVTKSADVTNASMNATIEYTIAVTVPATVGKADGTENNIVVTDTMEPGLTFVAEDGDNEFTATKSGQTLTWTIPASKAGSTVTLKYTAFINNAEGEIFDTSTVDGETVEVTNDNTVYITYSNFKSVDSTAKVKTYKASFLKVNAKDEPLEGVTFELWTNNGTNDTKIEVVDSSKTGENYRVREYDSEAEGVIIETDEEGKFVIAGLGNGKYKLIEKTTLDGYNLLTGPVAFEIKDNNNEYVQAEGTDGDNNVIVNNTGSELPSTGGIGTTIFYVVGGLMMAAALVLLVSKRKVSASK